MRLFNIGDRVRLDIEAIQRNGMDESKEQSERFRYIQDHPDTVYEISSYNSSPQVAAPVRLRHPVLGITSFFEDELILVGGNE